MPPTNRNTSNNGFGAKPADAPVDDTPVATPADAPVDDTPVDAPTAAPIEPPAPAEPALERTEPTGSGRAELTDVAANRAAERARREQILNNTNKES